MLEPVKFVPIPQERVWGGHRLKAWFGVEAEAPIGEYWVLSVHPHGLSEVATGPHAGMTLAALTQNFPDAYLGRSPQPRFPLLVKFIEAAADLSVQVHPDDASAQRMAGDFGKTEAWYVLDCREPASVVYGHRFFSRAEYLAAVATGTVQDYLCYRPIAKRQLLFVPARTLHALLAGTIVVEIQQTSDVTYRVYDWDRVGPDGAPRRLHTAEAGEVLDFPWTPESEQIVAPHSQPVGEGGVERLAACPWFVIDRLHVQSTPRPVRQGRIGNPDVLIVVAGNGSLHWTGGCLPLTRGDTVLIPATIQHYTLESTAGLEALRAFY